MESSDTENSDVSFIGYIAGVLFMIGAAGIFWWIRHRRKKPYKGGELLTNSDREELESPWL